MPNLFGKAFSQLLNLNILDELRIQGSPVFPSEIFRASWITAGGTQLQTLSANNTPEIIQFNEIKFPNDELVSLDTNTGIFTFNMNANIILAMRFQVVRAIGGGITCWGFFFELSIDDGVTWFEADDSLQEETFKTQELNDIQGIAFTADHFINAGTKVRISHITDDATKGMSIIASDPFPGVAPKSAGAIISISTV